MHSERRPALIDILCNNSIAEDCRKRSPLLFEAQTTRTPAAAKTGSECCVRDPRGTLPGIVEVPLCGKETPVNELEQVVDSKPAAQHLPLPNALQHCVATGHLSISAQATAVPLSEQLHLDHSYQGHYPGCMNSAGRRQLGACRSNAQAAEQHAPALSELQTSGRDRTGSRAMQLMQSRLQHSSSKQKQRKTAVCPTRTLPCARPKKQQKVGTHGLSVLVCKLCHCRSKCSSWASISRQRRVKHLPTGGTGCAGSCPRSWSG